MNVSNYRHFSVKIFCSPSKPSPRTNPIISWLLNLPVYSTKNLAEMLMTLCWSLAQEKLDARFAETERRLEEGAKKTATELHEKSKTFCETLRKETVSNFQFAKEQLDQFVDDKIKEIIKIEKAAEAKFEAQTLAYKKDFDEKTDMARKELINIMESRTTRHHTEMKERCTSNLSKMQEVAARLEQRMQGLEQAVSF